MLPGLTAYVRLYRVARWPVPVVTGPPTRLPSCAGAAAMPKTGMVAGAELIISGRKITIGKSMNAPKKSLGQHWLKDEPTLSYIADRADISLNDTVLEIGPGLGTLTKHLLGRAKEVMAVELDEALAQKLPVHEKLQVVQADILKFDLTNLPPGYKVVANIPYYLTSNLLRVLAESANPPGLMVLLVQKEVAQRIAAQSGQMSILSISVQLYYQPQLGKVVPAELFTPPPKIDSQVDILKRRQKPLFKELDSSRFFKIVKAGFSERRKKLRSSLAGGLGISKEQADRFLAAARVASYSRAQELSLQQWYRLYRNLKL